MGFDPGSKRCSTHHLREFSDVVRQQNGGLAFSLNSEQKESQACLPWPETLETGVGSAQFMEGPGRSSGSVMTLRLSSPVRLNDGTDAVAGTSLIPCQTLRDREDDPPHILLIHILTLVSIYLLSRSVLDMIVAPDDQACPNMTISLLPGAITNEIGNHRSASCLAS
jgi:hypothetical protein